MLGCSLSPARGHRVVFEIPDGTKLDERGAFYCDRRQIK